MVINSCRYSLILNQYRLGTSIKISLIPKPLQIRTGIHQYKLVSSPNHYRLVSSLNQYRLVFSCHYNQLTSILINDLSIYRVLVYIENGLIIYHVKFWIQTMLCSLNQLMVIIHVLTRSHDWIHIDTNWSEMIHTYNMTWSHIDTNWSEMIHIQYDMITHWFKADLKLNTLIPIWSLILQELHFNLTVTLMLILTIWVTSNLQDEQCL